MEKKYYYDCPIQALYMNKEFGVKFYTSFKNVKSDFLDKKLSFHVDIKDIYNVLIELLGIYNALSSDNKIYVALESEHIFEPKEGDLGIYEGKLWRLLNGRWFFWNDFEERTDDFDFTNIIERNGKNFFNPKEENYYD